MDTACDQTPVCGSACRRVRSRAGATRANLASASRGAFWPRRGNVQPVDFYFGKNSGNSARSAFALYEAGVAFAPHALDVPTGESGAADYRALNPLGKVPALLDGATALWESNAINWYVAESHPGAKLLPSTLAGRASVQRWLFFQAAHVSPAATAVNRELSARHRKYWKLQPDPPAAELGKRELARYLPVLESALAESGWLEGHFSLADIAYAPHLGYLLEGGFDFSLTPRVLAWLERLLARPAWQQARALVFDYY
jgi:glutathione S-transferase